ncbi:hypothetical protein [Halorussus salinisoli]|uniref:hypothetical protein n=1 Tax=Halorussus salinisoli TaxID=2558242 RepID=UPI0010C1B482|nr:hypothetical protein [Halorussus salinisoli]
MPAKVSNSGTIVTRSVVRSWGLVMSAVSKRSKYARRKMRVAATKIPPTPSPIGERREMALAEALADAPAEVLDEAPAETLDETTAFDEKRENR